MEWVEVRGKSIDIAVEAAMRELGIEDRNRIDVEVIQEPVGGFLGIGGKDAIVKVKPRQDGGRRKRRRRRKRGEGSSDGRDSRGGRQQQQGGRSPKPHPAAQRREKQGRSEGDRRRGDKGSDHRRQSDRAEQEGKTVSVDEQVPVVREFLEGLVEAFGLDGDVAVRTDEDTIVAEVTGGQTEAMVGPRGSVIEAIHELTKTVLQRKTQASARLRLDIAGYQERRRQALTIYANQLLDQVLEEGGEMMLEPMSAADRKVIHDAAAGRQGVRTYSEGESPQRYVVVASTKGEASEEE